MDESTTNLIDYDDLSDGSYSDTSDRDDHEAYEAGPSIYSEIFPPQNNAFYCRMFQETFLKNCKFPEYLRINVLRGTAKGVVTTKDINKEELISYYDGQRIYEQANFSGFDHYVEITSTTNTFWINGSEDDVGIAKYLREEKNNPNVCLGWGMCADKYYPVFYALTDIKAGDELVYSYEGRTEAYSWKTYTRHDSMIVSDKIMDCFDSTPKINQLETYDSGGTVENVDLRDNWIASFQHIDKRMENFAVFINLCSDDIQETAFLEYYNDIFACQRKFHDSVERLINKQNKISFKEFLDFRKHFTTFSEKVFESLYCVVNRNHDLLKTTFQAIVKISSKVGLQVLPKDVDEEPSKVKECLIHLSKSLVTFLHSLESVSVIIREVDIIKVAIAEIEVTVKDFLSAEIAGNATVEYNFLNHITPMIQATTKLLSVRYSTDLSVIKRTTSNAKELVIELLKMSVKTTERTRKCVVSFANSYISFLKSIISFRQKKNLNETELISSFQCVLLNLPEVSKSYKIPTDELLIRNCAVKKRKQPIDNCNENEITKTINTRKKQKIVTSTPAGRDNLVRNGASLGNVDDLQNSLSVALSRLPQNRIKAVNLGYSPVTNTTTASLRSAKKKRRLSDPGTGSSTSSTEAAAPVRHCDITENNTDTNETRVKEQLITATSPAELAAGRDLQYGLDAYLSSASKSRVCVRQLDEINADSNLEDDTNPVDNNDLEYSSAIMADRKSDISDTYVEDSEMNDTDSFMETSEAIGNEPFIENGVVGSIDMDVKDGYYNGENELVTESAISVETDRTKSSDCIANNLENSSAAVGSEISLDNVPELTSNCVLDNKPRVVQVLRSLPVIDFTYAINNENWRHFFRFRESFDYIVDSYTMLTTNWSFRGRPPTIKAEFLHLSNIHAYFKEHCPATTDGEFYLEHLFEKDLDILYTEHCLVSMTTAMSYHRRRLLAVFIRFASIMEQCLNVDHPSVNMYKEQLAANNHRLYTLCKRKAGEHSRVNRLGSLAETNVSKGDETEAQIPANNSYSSENSALSETHPINAEEPAEFTQNALEICNSVEESDNSKQTKGEIQKRTYKKSDRPLEKCPACPRYVENLKDHLIVHGFAAEDIRYHLLSSRQNGSNTSKGRTCPFDACRGMPPKTHLGLHLVKVHNIRKGGSLYNKTLQKRKRVLPVSRHSYSKFSNKVAAEYKKYVLSHFSEAYSKIQMYQIRQIIDGIGMTDLVEFASNKTKLKLQKWTVSFSETHRQSSVRTYLCTIISFINYLKDNRPDICKETLTKLSSDMDTLKKSFPKQAPEDRNAMMRSDFVKFDNSKVCLTAINYLSELKQFPRKANIAEHTNIRNVILLKTLCRNSCHAGVLAKLTVTQFLNAHKVHTEYRKAYVVSIKHNKTPKGYETDAVVLDESLYNLYVDYWKCIRNVYEITDHVVSFFLSWSGTSLNCDDISNGISAVWKSAGMVTKINPTIIRKIVKTTANKAENQEQCRLASEA